jgi:hypothetical protein
VAQDLTFTVLRMQIESRMAPMMTPLLTRRGSWQLRSDDFITPPPTTSSASRRRSRRPEEHPPGPDLPRKRRPKRPLDEIGGGSTSSEKWNGGGSLQRLGVGSGGGRSAFSDRRERREGSRASGLGGGRRGRSNFGPPFFFKCVREIRGARK